MDSSSPASARVNASGAIGSSFVLCLIIAVGLFFGIPLIDAQVPQIPSVSQEELASHLMTYVAPIYPAIAESAKVQGDVVISVEISPDGFVRSTKVLTGPAMLSHAATSALKQWRYSPFRSGNGTTAVTGNVLVSFTLRDKPTVHTPNESSANGSYTVSITRPPPDHRGEPDAEIAKRFDIPWDICASGVIAQATDMGTAKACKEAAAIADEFPLDRRFVERRQAYVYAATAYGNIRDLQTALHYADKAVDVVELGHDDNGGSSSAYSIRGKVRAFSGDLAGGDKDLSVAEDFCRKDQLSGTLKLYLQFHAELLKRMNRLQEAQAKLDEASKM
ncbi:MAG TPA: TonB family protein [Candidatus Angelobacter sp.]|nr:TonB family protein [Candidatus Angelobacter sp.]